MTKVSPNNLGIIRLHLIYNVNEWISSEEHKRGMQSGGSRINSTGTQGSAEDCSLVLRRLQVSLQVFARSSSKDGCRVLNQTQYACSTVESSYSQDPLPLLRSKLKADLLQLADYNHPQSGKGELRPQDCFSIARTTDHKWNRFVKLIHGRITPTATMTMHVQNVGVHLTKLESFISMEHSCVAIQDRHRLDYLDWGVVFVAPSR